MVQTCLKLQQHNFNLSQTVIVCPLDTVDNAIRPRRRCLQNHNRPSSAFSSFLAPPHEDHYIFLQCPTARPKIKMEIKNEIKTIRPKITSLVSICFLSSVSCSFLNCNSLFDCSNNFSCSSAFWSRSTPPTITFRSIF